MARRYRYEGEWYEDTEEGRFALASALVREEAGIVDDYGFECWVDERNTASQILWMVKEWGYDETIVTLWTDFEDWYAEENTEDILRDFSASYDTVEDDEEEDEDVDESCYDEDDKLAPDYVRVLPEDGSTEDDEE